jgi:hypothetical protein
MAKRLKKRRRERCRLSVSVERSGGPHLKCASVWLRFSAAAIATAPASPILLPPNRRPDRLCKAIACLLVSAESLTGRDGTAG